MFVLFDYRVVMDELRDEVVVKIYEEDRGRIGDCFFQFGLFSLVFFSITPVFNTFKTTNLHMCGPYDGLVRYVIYVDV